MLKDLLFIIVAIVLYLSIGISLENFKIIQAPAYFAAYGASYTLVAVIIWNSLH